MFDAGLLSGIRPPQATIPPTDLSPEMNGAPTGAQSAPVNNGDEQFILYGGAAVVIVSIVCLWLLGAVAFRGLPSV